MKNFNETFNETLKKLVEKGDFLEIAKMGYDLSDAKAKLACKTLVSLAEKQLTSSDIVVIAEAYSSLKFAIRGYTFGEFDNKLRTLSIMLGARLLFLYQETIEKYLVSEQPTLEMIISFIKDDEAMINKLTQMTAKSMGVKARLARAQNGLEEE